MLVSNLNVKSNFRINRSISILNGKPKNVKTAPNPFSFHFLLENAEGRPGFGMRHFKSYWYISFLNGKQQKNYKGEILLTG